TVTSLVAVIVSPWGEVSLAVRGTTVVAVTVGKVTSTSQRGSIAFEVHSCWPLKKSVPLQPGGTGWVPEKALMRPVAPLEESPLHSVLAAVGAEQLSLAFVRLV